MPPVHFTVSQVRSAAACPRILYFDAADARARRLRQPSVTRVWKSGGSDFVTACGTLFHDAVEAFNDRAAQDPAVREMLAGATDARGLAQALLAHVYRQHVDHAALFQKSGAQQQAFMAALQRYPGELADVLVHARACAKPPAETLRELFGDRRRRVDVTFPAGPAGGVVRVTGVLDYVFFDWRAGRHRIIDYKLTFADKPADDLFQVCVYALMHHAQHRTEPGAGVLYLHPTRHMIEKPWDQVYAGRQVVYDLLASMRAWVQYDEASGQGKKPPGEPLYCAVCRWSGRCERRLGPKGEGQRQRDTHRYQEV
jgi:hypothetical protein